MNENIFITDFSKIKLNDSLLTLKTPKGEIALDIHFLLNQDSNSEHAYFNATDLAKMFDREMKDLIRNDNWKEYVTVIERKLKLQNRSFSENFKIKAKDKRFYTSLGVPKAIYTKRGRNGSTWLHHKLAIQFVRMVSVEWGVDLDEFMADLIRHTTKIKLERKDTKFLFHPLTDAIKDIYIPAQKSGDAIKWAYANIADLVNIKALGMTAKSYKKLHGITDKQIKEEGKISIRDYMSKAQLNKIKLVEQDIWGLIKYANLTSYEDIKARIERGL